MSNYTSDEITAAVTSLISDSISRSYDVLGVKKADVVLTQVQQSAAGVFLLYPKTPFYLLYLGAQNIRQLIQSEALILDQLVAAIQATGRRVLPIADVSPLFNAQVALQSLGSAAAGRRSGFNNISTVPAYQRFVKNIDSFLASNKASVKESGQIVSTPQQARMDIPGLLNQLQTSHLALVQAVTTLANGAVDYSGLNLSALVAQGVINNAASVIGTHATTLQAQLPVDRLQSMRQVALDCLTTKSLVTGFGSFGGATDFYSISGIGTPYSDSTHPITPASAIATIPGPYNFQTVNNGLDLYLDGAVTPLSITLPTAQAANLSANFGEQTYTNPPPPSATSGFIIGNGTHPTMPTNWAVPNNNLLKINLNGTVYSVPLTVSADGSAGVQATPRTATQICADITAALSAHNYQASIIPSSSPAKIQITAIDAGSAVNSKTSIFLVGDTSVSIAAASTLGFTLGVVSQSLPQTAKTIAASINKATTQASGTAVFQPVLSNALARSTSGNNSLLTFSKQLYTANVSFSAGTSIYSVTGAKTAGISVGDTLMHRSGGQIGAVYEISAVTDSSITAVLVAGAGATESNVSIEIGATVDLQFYEMIRVTSGVNKGDYYVAGQNYLDITLTSSLALSADPKTGLNVTFTCSAGPETLVIASANSTTTSSLKIRGTAQPALYHNTDPGYLEVYGQTLYFQLPQTVPGLAVGDLLQLYSSNYKTPDFNIPIAAVQKTLITLQSSVSANTTWSFANTTTVPFAQLHTSHVFDFNEFQAEMTTWLGLGPQQAAYFTDLNRLINPLLANSSPTPVQVNDAIAKLGTLYSELNTFGVTTYQGTFGTDIDSIMASYFVDKQPQVDAMLVSLREKGADKAVDLLLAGEFQTFFGLTPQTTSYAGSLQAASQAVAMNDLPMKKTGRKDATVSRLSASSATPDPDYNLSDTEIAFPDPVTPGDYTNP